MARSRRRGGLFLAGMLGASFPSVAMANVPVPSFYGFGAPFYLSVSSLGALFAVIVVVEALALRVLAGLSWKRSLGVSLAANVVTSVFGLLISTGSNVVFLFAIVASCVLYRDFRRNWGYGRLRSLVLALGPVALTIPWVIVTSPQGRALELWTVYVSLGLAFLVSVLIEAVVLRAMMKSKPRWRGPLVGNAASYGILVAVLLLLPFRESDIPVSNTYLWLSAKSFAESGQPDRAMEMVNRMRASREDSQYDPRLMEWELEIAQELIARGHTSHARTIIERAKRTPYEGSSREETIDDEIRFLQRRIDKATTDSVVAP